MGWGGWWFLGGKDLREELPAEPVVPVPVDFGVNDVPITKENEMGKMNISQKGVELIQREEGFRNKAYLDSVGVWTIGYGTIKMKGVPVKKGDICSKAEAYEWLMDEINEDIVPHINRLVKVPLTQDMFDVLCSFIYNLGWPAFAKSTLLKMLNAGDYAGAGDQILRWNKGRVNGQMVAIDGLTNRRKREREIFVASIGDLNANIG